MSISLGIGIKIGGNGGTNWTAYWAANSSLYVKSDARSGLTLAAEIGDNVTIMPAYLNLPSTATNLICTDNQALDIGTTDFTICAWIKSETATNPAILYGFLNKYRASALNGRYGFVCGATGEISFTFTTSTTSYSLMSGIFIANQTWNFHMVEIDQAAKIARYFIDGAQVGADTAFLGTCANLDNAFKFRIGTMNSSTGSSTQYSVPSSYSDIRVYHKLLLTAEKATLYARGNVAGAAVHFPCLGTAYSDTAVSEANSCILYDSMDSGLTAINSGAATRANYLYSSYGSRYGIDVGYTLYSNGYESIYVPVKANGSDITMTPPVGFFKVRTILGDATNYNLSNAKLRIADGNFDRSDATIYSNLARAGYYDAANPGDWHVAELNNLQKADWCNTDYKGLNYVWISDNSYGVRKLLNGIYSLTANKTGTEYNNILKYFGDYLDSGIYETEQFYYKFSNYNIVASRDAKQLRLDAATSTVYLSLDEGVTWAYSKVVAGLDEIKFAYICSSGVIAFGGKRKFYRSADNLATVNEITPKGIDGNDFVASTDDSFACTAYDNFVEISGTEVVVWGNYESAANQTNDNVNIWATKDDFATLKSVYKAAVTNPPNLGARHIHVVSFNPNDNSFIAQTGDGTDTCNWIKGEWNLGADSWAWSKLAGDNVSSNFYANSTYYKTCGIVFPTDYALWASDSDSVTKSGIWKVAIADLVTSANYVNVFPFPYIEKKSNNLFYDGVNMIATTPGDVIKDYIAICKDDGVTFKAARIYGRPTGFDTGTFFAIHPKSTAGWYILQVVDAVLADIYLGTTLFIKVK